MSLKRLSKRDITPKKNPASVVERSPSERERYEPTAVIQNSSGYWGYPSSESCIRYSRSIFWNEKGLKLAEKQKS